MDWVEIFKNFDVNDIFGLIAASMVLLVIFASCIQPFRASKIEVVLMNKSDELKRISFTYVVSFCLFGLANYMLVQDMGFIIICFISLVLVGVICGILFLTNCFGKAKKIFAWCKEQAGLLAIILFFPIVIYVVFVVAGIKLASSAVLGSLVECIFIAFIYMNSGSGESSIIINVDNDKWYVFKRIDDNYLLCGDKISIKLSTKVKLLPIEAAAEAYFEK